MSCVKPTHLISQLEQHTCDFARRPLRLWRASSRSCCWALRTSGCRSRSPSVCCPSTRSAGEHRGMMHVLRGTYAMVVLGMIGPVIAAQASAGRRYACMRPACNMHVSRVNWLSFVLHRAAASCIVCPCCSYHAGTQNSAPPRAYPCQHHVREPLLRHSTTHHGSLVRAASHRSCMCPRVVPDPAHNPNPSPAVPSPAAPIHQTTSSI